MEWYPVFYNGLETNVEVTKCGKVKRVKKDWYGFSKMCTNLHYGEVDFSKLKPHPQGYKIISIQVKTLQKKKTTSIHQLVAAAFLNYKWNGHKLVVDHIDSNKLNNNIDNLRIITSRENTSKERSLKSGLPTGVCFCKQTKKYSSEIQINGKKNHLGRFNTPEEASQVYQDKLKSLK
jgi:hypothetical protein